MELVTRRSHGVADYVTNFDRWFLAHGLRSGGGNLEEQYDRELSQWGARWTDGGKIRFEREQDMTTFLLRWS